MIFNSFTYLLFLSFFVLFYYNSSSLLKSYLIFTSSIIFYGFWRIDFVFLLLFSVIVDYFCGIKISQANNNSNKKKYLYLSLIINLGILFFFKYTFFFLENINYLFESKVALSFNIILPLGISFYTFQSISYTIDIYRKKTNPTKNFILYANYVIFFPQLIAGPILRSHEVIKQLQKNNKFKIDNLINGVKKIVLGLFLKLCLADNLAKSVDYIYSQDHTTFSSWDVLTASFSYGFQIYFDFAGYSLIAIGSALLIGLKFPENFNFPYLSKSPREFWMNWHITLSSWIRDYIYLPLLKIKSQNSSTKGLNISDQNKDKKYYWYIYSLLVTWLMMGLWHGAHWSFAIWGIYHALLVLLWRIVYKFHSMNQNIIYNFFSYISFLIFIMLSWIPFKTQNVEKTFDMWSYIFIPDRYLFLSLHENIYIYLSLLLLGIFLSKHLYYKFLFIKNEFNAVYQTLGVIMWSIIVTLVFAYMKQSANFIYFQF